MTERPQISPGETTVMKALWSIRKGSVGETFHAIDADRNMDYATVQTYVRRLEAKGYLRAERVGRNKVYYPAVKQHQVVRAAVEEFVDRIFDGEMLPMVRHLIKSNSLSGEDIDELRAIVDKLRKDD